MTLTESEEHLIHDPHWLGGSLEPDQFEEILRHHAPEHGLDLRLLFPELLEEHLHVHGVHDDDEEDDPWDLRGQATIR
jgi:hypothetical protein